MKDKESASTEQAGRPGKLRTWWHPLLVRMLNHLMATAYEVRDEELVGRMPLRVDIVLIRREQGQLSASAVRDLGVLVPLLNQWTLVEFKGPTDTLEPGDLAQLIGCAFLWHSQQAERVPPKEVSLVILAPRMNDALREDLRLFGWLADQREPGVFFIEGGPWTTWMIETDVMAERGQPVLSLVSHTFLKQPQRIMKVFKNVGQRPLLYYALQQIHQFYMSREEFAMQHTDTEYLGELEEDLKAAVLEWIPPEDKLRGVTPEDLRGVFTAEELLRSLSPEEVIRSLPPEERLRGLPPEERMRGLSPEERIRGLSDEELEQLRELLERR